MPDTPEARLQELGIVLPEQLRVLGTHRLATRYRNIVYIASHVSARLDGSELIRGKVGADLTVEQAQEAARMCALYMLSTLRAEIGSLDQVAQILKVDGMINVAPGFVLMATVVDGCTNELAEIFGDAGIPARVAVGMAEVPMDVAVETGMTVALRQ